MTKAKAEAWRRSDIKTTLQEARDFIEGLLPRLVTTHFGKYLVSRADTREYWIADTEEEALKMTIEKTCAEPRPAIGTVGYYHIVSSTTYRTFSN